ncbi:MAG: ABC transporter permease [Gemmatimonadales bacterium]
MADAPRPFADRPLAQLVLARIREYYREPEALFWTFVFPLLMAAGLAVAFRSRPPEVPSIGVVAGPEADSLVAALTADSAFRAVVLDDSTGLRRLTTGKVAILVRQRADSVEYQYDPTRPEGLAARRAVDDALQRGAGRTDPIPVREQAVTERGSRYIDFLIPGLLGMSLMSNSMWGIGYGVVDQRRRKLLRRFVATPMSRSTYLASFAIARLTVLPLEAGFLVTIGALVFGVPVRGSLVTLGLVCLLSTVSFGGLGLLIAARPKTVEAAGGLMNFAMLPMWVLSGVFFSSDNFPAAVQPLIKALPLTAANDALRATMLDGAGLLQIAPSLGVLAIWLVLSFPLAVRIFRWN